MLLFSPTSTIVTPCIPVLVRNQSTAYS
uniref:Uncharacterized protein n=1 Tax=Anguilla anguilla TaxID=7936 RepID=A0A0E9UVA2_ANGAN